MATSVVVQLCFVLIGAVIPLLYTAELPIGHMLTESWLLAPPPLPPPAAAAVPEIAPAPQIERFERELHQPRAIPDQVAIIDDGASQPAPVISRAAGVVGLGEAGTSGIFGMGRLGLSSVPPPRRIRRGGHVQEALLVTRVRPLFPVEAIERLISGLVILEAIIGVDGSIHEVKVISGDPLLAASTVEAVKQWRYRPTALNGMAVEVITRIEVTFKIQEPETADGKKGKNKRNKKKRS